MKLLISIFLVLLTGSVALANYDLTNGKGIYDQSCFTCHADGVADAPRAHDITTWQKYFATAASITKTDATSVEVMTYLVNQVIRGKAAMPPNGLCAQCTKQDFADAIYYMSKGDN